MNNSLSKYRINIITLISIFFFFLLLTSCRDDFGFNTDDDVPEGLPTAFRIYFKVDEASLATRSDMTADKETAINSLWIGFFSEKGDLSKSYSFGQQEEGVNHSNHYLDINQLTSGIYHIVAVANPDDNFGISHNMGFHDRTHLNEILEEVENLDDFNDIAVVRGTPGSILVPANPLPMIGVFVKSNDKHPENSDEAAALIDDTIGIYPNDGDASQYNLAGKIHFRRLISQIKFNVTCNYENIDKESFEIVEAKVFNVPTSSWLAERKSTDACVNSGDSDNMEYPGTTMAKKYLSGTPVFLSSDFYETENGFGFDWWQMENRRTAVNKCKSYADREKEYKEGSDDSDNIDTDRNTGKNTQVYKALSSAPNANKSNVNKANYATFVELRVRMKLTPSKVADGFNNGDSKVDMEGLNYNAAEIDAVYTIHLGYINNKLDDFNCHRNFKYIYNVTINDVNSIIVEANKGDYEPESGQEGIATLVTDRLFEADAHYALFNIKLSDKERKEMKWLIRAYDAAGNNHDITNKRTEAEKRYLEEANNDNRLLWDWIEFRPTMDESEIAEYDPQATDHKMFGLDQITNLAEYPGWSVPKVIESSDGNIEYSDQEQYYTVFVNEYVYETTNKTSMATANWKDYVNLPDRNLWLKVTEWRSNDYESAVVHAKYALRQKSIQTFYETGNIVFGTELSNETDFTSIKCIDKEGNIISGVVFEWIREITQHEDMTDWEIAMNNEYNTLKDLTAWQKNLHFINYNYNLKYWDDILYMESLEGNTDNPYNIRKLKRDNNRTMFRACLNRNRDLNGNGVIDEDEIRWILPDKKVYTYASIGQDGLRSKLYDAKKKLPDLGIRAYHYGMIEGDMFWAEQGCATGWMGDGRGGWPSEVRCVRLLGNIDASDLKEKNPDNAFAHSKIGGKDVVEFKFNNTAYREMTIAPLPPHYIGSDYNRPPHKLEIDLNSDGVCTRTAINNYINNTLTDIQKNDIDKNITKTWALLGFSPRGDDNSDYPSKWVWSNLWDASKWYWMNVAHNPCDDRNINSEKGWRTPNLTEIAALFYLELLPKNGYQMSITAIQYPDWAKNTNHNYHGKFYRESLGADGKTQINSVSGDYSHYDNAYFICVRDVE